ncbi:hypothetical protein [Salicibibacter kimchii]|uniref:Uncharacterized protein n=1 Tax=Salicibibacter kimchii TaxID=2099786 RepID=A0A345C306_9BACI|nr:hypothetical protein [Salicibibacter kimchii]AXF57587.1 hypothetical protein DT065_17400 [Salicibibacter kimchii]
MMLRKSRSFVAQPVDDEDQAYTVGKVTSINCHDRRDHRIWRVIGERVYVNEQGFYILIFAERELKSMNAQRSMLPGWAIKCSLLMEQIENVPARALP